MLRHGLGAVLLLVSSGMAAAQGGLAVSPVRLDLAPGARAVSMTVSNDTAAPKRLHVEALRWTQAEGEDRYEPQPELIVNPASFLLPAGASQIVRAGFRGGAAATTVEGAYRIYLQEMPEEGVALSNQLRLLLRIGVPLFVAPQAPLPDAPSWSVRNDAGGRPAIHLDNRGNRRLRFSDLVLRDGAEQSFPLVGLAYVLAGQQRQWPLPPAAHGALRVLAQSDRGAVDVALPSP